MANPPLCDENGPRHRWQYVWDNDEMKVVQCERCQVYEARPLRNGTRVLPLLMIYAVHSLVMDGLRTDGAHHKQWYLAEIAKAIGLDVSDLDQGIAP